MKMTNQEYNKHVKSKSPKTNYLKNIIMAFLIGGGICTIGQGFEDLYKHFGLNEKHTASAVPITMIFLGALLTGLGIYGKIAKHAGAGTLVPITGFSNAIVSPAMEFKSEGHITGVGAKMFTIAGPVLVYGIITSMIYGLIYYSVKMFIK